MHPLLVYSVMREPEKAYMRFSIAVGTYQREHCRICGKSAIPSLPTPCTKGNDQAMGKNAVCTSQVGVFPSLFERTMCCSGVSSPIYIHPNFSATNSGVSVCSFVGVYKTIETRSDFSLCRKKFCVYERRFFYSTA